MHTFEPPTVNIPFRGLLDRWGTEKGQTVYRYNGTWYQVQDPFWGNATTTGVKDADLVPVADRPGGERTDNTDRDRYLFFGGRVYTVSDAVGATLNAAGYETTSTIGGPAAPAHWSELEVRWSEMTVRWSEL